MTCKIISIVNQKGGTGKTATSANLGVSLANSGKKVMIVDLDSQANLSMCLGQEPELLDKTIVDLLSNVSEDKEINKQEYLLQYENIDFIPSDIRLSGMENTLTNVIGRESILKNAIESYKNDYDFILIDCAPSLNIITINALAASNSVLIPVQSHYLSAKGLELLLNTVSKVKKYMNPDLCIEGILLTMFDKRTNFAKAIASAIRENYSDRIKVFENMIPFSIKMAESTSQGKSIFEYEPNSQVALAYAKFSEEVLSNA